MRISELCFLKVSDVNLYDGTILIYGKGDKERRIQIGTESVIHVLDRIKGLVWEADDYAEEICQTGGTAEIYGMTPARMALVQNREILRLLLCIYRCTVFYGNDGSGHGFAAIYAAVTYVSFFERMY